LCGAGREGKTQEEKEDRGVIIIIIIIGLVCPTSYSLERNFPEHYCKKRVFRGPGLRKKDGEAKRASN